MSDINGVDDGLWRIRDGFKARCQDACVFFSGFGYLNLGKEMFGICKRQEKSCYTLDLSMSFKFRSRTVRKRVK